MRTEDAPVERHTAEELATSAQVSVERIHHLERLGVLTPSDGSFSAGDVRRIRLVESCERAGIPAESLATAIAEGRLSFAFLDLEQYAWPVHTQTTFAELCRREGVDVDLARRLFVSASVPAPTPDGPARADDLPLVRLVAAASAAGLDEYTMDRSMRVYGENLRRMAAAEASLYHDLIETPMLRSGMSDREMTDVASATVAPLDPLLSDAVQNLWHRHREHHWLADMVEHIEHALEGAGLATPRDPPAMCFLDLTGYTSFTEEHGDARAADLATTLGDIVESTSRHHHGLTVKWLGDGMMCYFPAPADGVRGAVDMVARVAEGGLPPAHVGLAAGPVVIREGDYFGRTVNLASRIAQIARPGQVLVTDEVTRHAAETGIAFRPIGPVELKGVPEPIPLHEAVGAG